MRRIIITVILVLLTVLLVLLLAKPVMAKAPKLPNSIYPHMGAVTSCQKIKKRHCWKVTFKDCVGRKWSWYDHENANTWQKGDFVSVIMYDNGTKDCVFDDIVIPKTPRYVGSKKFF